MTNYGDLARAAERLGLTARGGFHPQHGDDVPPLPDGGAPGTLVLLGFVARGGFDRFATSAEAGDGEPDPLDRWSRLRIGGLAAAFAGVPLFPFGGPPWHPFQRWAQRSETVYPSPLGLLIHPDWGLWHSWRGAVALRERLELPSRDERPSPCASCSGRPCLSACPVGAFSGTGYDAAGCRAHLAGRDGGECMAEGCLARRACPVGRDHAYAAAQASFGMAAFRRAGAV
jgi:hypothetical protein